MDIFRMILKLNIKEIFSLMYMAVRNPLYIVPTLRATKKTIKICNQWYPKIHHGHGVENAFRHALWNMLVAKYVLEYTPSNVNKSIQWAAKITDMHEKLSPNKAIEMTMDLHNNKVGRWYFKTHAAYSIDEMVTLLQQEMKQAHPLKNEKEQLLTLQSNRLVYLDAPNKV